MDKGGVLNLESFFSKALTYDEYVSRLGENLALHQQHYKKFEIPVESAAEIKRIKPLNILVLTEPWCGDSLAVFPVVKRMSESNPRWDIKVLQRDENTELMDQFLTRGGRAIPVFLFLEKNGSLIFRWGPRPKAAQDIFEQFRMQISEGKMEKSDVIKKIRKFYAKDRGKTILSELISIFKEMRLL